ncbi:hypothetical protein M3180_08530 [Paenibacillus camelliae]|nr:hypothetical protein [Paenibacillus camelliae]
MSPLDHYFTDSVNICNDSKEQIEEEQRIIIGFRYNTNRGYLIIVD